MPTLLDNMSSEFADLAARISQGEDMEVRAFARAGSHITSLVRLLGRHFKFAETDVAQKVDDLNTASRSFPTLISMLEADIEQNTLRNANSHSRNLLRLKRIIEMVKILFEQIIASNFDESGSSWASKGLAAYSAVFGQQHAPGLQATLTYYSDTIPTQGQFLAKLKENEASCEANMRIIVEAAGPIIQYIDNLFLSRGLRLDS
ncbi:hypothetical protein MKW94_024909 [Papaver nudicaule]|uniref:Glycolipid transfer protein domain-containing protein n=1 Tax=Papaver nudicaule TaxID=74823 RepID=A0AA41VXQ1_PAPNU|nr:hypothetical protein [Papaver nudicaule]